MKVLKNFIMLVLYGLVAISFAACHGNGGGSHAQTSDNTHQNSGLDLTGTWGTNIVSSDPVETVWERGSLTINADNSISVSSTKSNGTSTTSSGTITMNANGTVTLVDPGAIDLYPDSGGTVMHGVTVDNGGEKLYTALKKADSYEAADVQGAWKANILLTGPGLFGWERGAINIEPLGTFTAATFSANINGIVGSVTSDGSVTVSNSGQATATMPSALGLEGVMDADKTVIVWTGIFTGGTGTGTELAVLTKQAASYAEADLVGTWKFSTISAGTASSTAHGTVTVSSGGSAVIEEAGVQGTRVQTLAISADGTVTIEGFPAAQGAMDAGKTVIVFTETLFDPTGQYGIGSDIVIFTKQ